MDKYIEYKCLECGENAEIIFTLHSHDEYYADESCNNCGAKIPQNILDKIYNDEPIDWLSSKVDGADYYNE